MINIYVGNLPYDSNDDQVRQLFEQYGAVTRVHLVTDNQTGQPRGFGFVDMEDDNAGRQAIEKVNGQNLNGRTLRVNEARPREPRGRSNWRD